MFKLTMILICSLFLLNTSQADDEQERRRLAGHPAITLQTAIRLTQDPAWEVRQVLARNRKT
ncbi:MAG: hypothetical protein OEZ33_07800, partial [Gammaproteobacteria bacterium]|nr:hypothetical protein [Gammaproteobacteria bacterium]